MKKILSYLTTFLLLFACKHQDKNQKEYLASVTVNGTTWNTDNTFPAPSGSHVTLYYYASSNLLTYSIINDETQEKIVLILKIPNAVDNVTYKFDDNAYVANFYMKEEGKLMNKKVTGEIKINQLTFNNGTISNFNASFSFTQNALDIEGKAYTHKVENATIKNLKQTL